jgi:hypothetical protein
MCHGGVEDLVRGVAVGCARAALGQHRNQATRDEGLARWPLPTARRAPTSVTSEDRRFATPFAHKPRACMPIYPQIFPLRPLHQLVLRAEGKEAVSSADRSDRHRIERDRVPTRSRCNTDRAGGGAGALACKSN